MYPLGYNCPGCAVAEVVVAEATPRKIELYMKPDGEVPFADWLDAIKNAATRARIDARLARVESGNLGVHKAVGEGVKEFVFTFGPGYRVYFAEHGSVLVILLTGSTKRDQAKQIENAKQFWQDWKARRQDDE